MVYMSKIEKTIEFVKELVGSFGAKNEGLFNDYIFRNNTKVIH
jgi:hypothetical protein